MPFIVPERGKNEHPNWTDVLVITLANGKSTTSAFCICGWVCKDLRGLKIHLTKMACLMNGQETQCTEEVASTRISVVPIKEPG